MKMITSLRSVASAATLALAASGLAAQAEPVATVLAVTGAAQGPSGPVEAGSQLVEGTTIRTGPNTQMQLEFIDGTRMAVGPNSELVISAVLMANSSQASRFAVNAVGGSFRFISGNSARTAYEIETPTATIGIRGTEFDIFASGDRTGVLLYRGVLELCLPDGSKCWQFRGSCAAAFAEPGRNRVFGLSDAQTRAALGGSFPYSLDQSTLLEELRTQINSCNKYFRDRTRSVPVVDEEDFVDDEGGNDYSDYGDYSDGGDDYVIGDGDDNFVGDGDEDCDDCT